MKIKSSKGERVFDFFNVTLMAVYAFICLYPFLYVIILSLNDGKDAMRGGIYFWPRVWTLDNYATLFQDKRLLGSFLISVIRTVSGIALSMIVNSMYAYALTKKDLPFRKVFNWIIIVPMYFGGGIIPYYLICKGIGITNTIWVYIIPAIAVSFYILLLRTSMSEFPPALEESAQLDGAGYFTIFWKLIMPLSLPSLATIGLLTGIAHWNDWLDGTIMVSNSRLWPMQTLLLNILQGADIMAFFKGKNLNAAGAMVKKIAITPESLKMAMLVITIVPIFMIYPFAQKYFIKGMMVGSVKG